MNNLNFKNIKGLLSRDEMRQVKGGSGGGCAVFVRLDGGGNYWSSCIYSASWAQTAYATGGDPLYGGYSVTGYCCASCSHC